MKYLKYKVKTEMKSPLLKPWLWGILLSLFNIAADATLKTDKSVINHETGSAILSVSFPEPLQGDLFIATQFNGQLYFFANNGLTITTLPTPYTKNGQFIREMVVLTLASDGIPPGLYPFFQVVTKVGADPLDVRNWVGGLAGLSGINISVNEQTTVATVTPKPTETPVVTREPTPTTVVTTVLPTPTVTPSVTPTERPTPIVTVAPTAVPTPSPIPRPTTIPCVEQKSAKSLLAKSGGSEGNDDGCKTTPTPTPTQVPVSTALDGKALYLAQCASCHGKNPGNNSDHILKGKDPSETREAINKNKGSMGQPNLKALSDAQLQAIASYLQGF